MGGWLKAVVWPFVKTVAAKTGRFIFDLVMKAAVEAAWDWITGKKEKQPEKTKARSDRRREWQPSERYAEAA